MHLEDVLSYLPPTRPSHLLLRHPVFLLDPISTPHRGQTASPALCYTHRTSALPAACALEQDNVQQQSAFFRDWIISEQNTADPFVRTIFSSSAESFLKSSQTPTKPELCHIAGARDGHRSSKHLRIFQTDKRGVKSSCSCSLYSK